MILIEIALLILAVFAAIGLYVSFCLLITAEWFRKDAWKDLWMPVVSAFYLYFYITTFW